VLTAHQTVAHLTGPAIGHLRELREVHHGDR
jgi:hypothetical protein